MIVLSIETTGPKGSVAVTAKGELRSIECFPTQGRLGAELAPAIDRALLAAGLSHASPPDIVAVDIGPGSYTGTRVGLAAAKGLAFGWRRPLIGLSSFQALATQAPGQLRRALCVIDARKGEYYAALFERTWPQAKGLPVCQQTYTPGIIAPLDLVSELGDEPLVIIGNGAEFVDMALPRNVKREIAPIESAWPDAVVIAALADRAYHQGRLDDALSITPVYMRPSAPEQAAARKRRRTTARL